MKNLIFSTIIFLFQINSFAKNTDLAFSISTTKTTICDGDSAIITASACSSNILWSDGRIGLSITVNKAGTYSANCQATNEVSNFISIVVQNTPTPLTITTSKMIVCGSSDFATLTTSGCLGTAIWSTGEVGQTIRVKNDGVYAARCQNTCGISVQSNTIAIQVKYPPSSAPTIIADKLFLCTRDSITLSSTSNCVGGIIQWSNGMHGNTIKIHSIGTYLAKCDNICGISDNSNAITIGNKLPPKVTASQTLLCSSDSATLTAENCNSNIVWNNGLTGKQILINKAGTYYITCNNLCDFVSQSNTLTIEQILSQCIMINYKLIK